MSDQPTLALTKAEIEWLLSNQDDARNILAIADAEQHLLPFMELCWPVLEPATPFVRGWAFDAIAEHLEAVHRGEIEKLLMNVPPGFSKSLTTDVFFPAWEWGPRNKAFLKYLCASYGQHLTERDNNRFRKLVKSDIYQKAWGDRVVLERDSVIKIENKATGFKFATSSSGVGTGERAHRRIVDDPHNVHEAESDTIRMSTLLWFTETLPTRVIPVPQGYEGRVPTATIIIMQRVHEQDVSGHILSDANNLGYEHLCIEMEFDPSHPCARKRRSRIGWRDPRAARHALGDETAVGALAWPELHTRVKVSEQQETLRSIGGEYAVAGQFQQWPVSRLGGMFDVSQLQYCDPHEVPGGMTGGARGWDLAGSTKSTSPYTAAPRGKYGSDGRLYIMDVYRARVDAGVLEDAIVNVIQADGHDVEQDLPQDPGQAGKAQVRSIIKRCRNYLVWSSQETGEKSTRAKPFASQVNGGNVTLVRGPWNTAFVAEMKMFPAGKYKDQIDGASRLVTRLNLVEEVPAPAGGFVVSAAVGPWRLD